MNIKKTWNEQNPLDPSLSEMLQNDQFKDHRSDQPLAALSKNLRTGICWGIIITLFFIFLIFFYKIWQVNLALGVVIIFNLWIIYDSWKLYKSIRATKSAVASLRQELEKHYGGFQQWWSIQMRGSLFVFPFAATGGFILGGVLGSDKTPEHFIYNTRMLVILAITILILSPICYYAAKLMFKYTYGKHLQTLKQLLHELDDETKIPGG